LVEEGSLTKDKKSILTIKLIEKKLLVSPKIDLLSFEPESVLQTEVPFEPIEQKIYYEYLASANEEIMSKIEETRELKTEIENIILLRETSEDFLEEINFDNDIIGYTSINENQDKAYTTNRQSYGKDINTENDMISQTVSFSEILNQVKLSSMNKIQIYTINDLNSYTKTNIYEFKKLIDQVEKQLVEYNSVIKSKLKKN